MPRRNRAEQREVIPDSRYGSTEVTKFINMLMLDGKKSLAEQIFYDAMQNIEMKTGQPAMNVFRQALQNAKPILEVRSRRVGGATYQVPMEVSYRRRDSLARRWLVQYSRARSGKTMAQRLAGELLDAARGDGGAVRKKEDVHRMADANKAFAHYRW
ncbi:MAG: 30S ribosomal protein S7 [Gemmatimonadales bacterium]|uniref:30S ribosomal protein S7 n=1 Tax=Candidatus Palauibacter TaxID=3056650 RepID=UPI0013828B37|nr:30S ribosomal protein S7 [Candidatus Palauibacter polyketidifaciens]MCY3599593.1 30S ribosomal protein S7 [Candidatus Palauibacter australiensis]MXW67119.1 30S ribosomal protein S7 [Candidatus Palauibacter irciniicola]MXX68745.1 30S ribosomal protein S7 [Gemmatimonadales bacterium]MDE2720048.1 30S ribosomal protein S7 [Candidatus Palauibacter polyketidifaciens]MYC17955.1 30S ribosomal protein S7 [Gemmatimonadales bacterium]